jgi:hypothetical protein
MAEKRKTVGERKTITGIGLDSSTRKTHKDNNNTANTTPSTNN